MLKLLLATLDLRGGFEFEKCTQEEWASTQYGKGQDPLLAFMSKFPERIVVRLNLATHPIVRLLNQEPPRTGKPEASL